MTEWVGFGDSASSVQHSCRVLGSRTDAENAVQETLRHACRYHDSEGRRAGAPLATNARIESRPVVWLPASYETFQ